MKILGIPVSGMLYYVNWVLTNAQLELIAADVSVVDYNTRRLRDGKRGRKKGEFNDRKASEGDVKKAREEWMKRYGGGSQPKSAVSGGIALSDVFG